MGSSMASELGVLAHALKAIALSDRRTRDFTLTALSKTIVEVVACLPCYRTYVSAAGFSAADREHDRRRRRSRTAIQSGDGAVTVHVSPQRAARREQANGKLPALRQFAMKFQQFSAPVQAKGVEDTSFYRVQRAAVAQRSRRRSSRFGTSPDEFHAGNRVRLERWPRELLATATHDTKRGEDARARLNVLSEMPALWRRSVSEWRKLNAGHRTAVDRASAPDANDEYLFYQALVGSWPAEHARRADSRRGAARARRAAARLHAEGHQRGQDAHELVQSGRRVRGCGRTVRRNDARGSAAKRFLKSFVPFVRRVSVGGMVNSLAQLVLKVASPGVPDFYQGTEFWQLDLADPDNRRPVDFRAREAMLAALMPWIERAEARHGDPRSVRMRSRVGAYVERPARRLAGRANQDVRDGVRAPPPSTRASSCLPRALPANSRRGRRSPHLVAFARTLGTTTVIAVVPRLMNRTPRGSTDSGWRRGVERHAAFLSPDSTGSILSSRVYRRSIEVR